MKIPGSLIYVAVPVLEWRGLSLSLSLSLSPCTVGFMNAVNTYLSSRSVAPLIISHEWLASISYRRKITPCARRTGYWMETIADVDVLEKTKIS